MLSSRQGYFWKNCDGGLMLRLRLHLKSVASGETWNEARGEFSGRVKLLVKAAHVLFCRSLWRVKSLTMMPVGPRILTTANEWFLINSILLLNFSGTCFLQPCIANKPQSWSSAVVKGNVILPTRPQSKEAGHILLFEFSCWQERRTRWKKISKTIAETEAILNPKKCEKEDNGREILLERKLSIFTTSFVAITAGSAGKVIQSWGNYFEGGSHLG